MHCEPLASPLTLREMSELPESVRQLVEAAIVRSPYGRLLGLALVSAEEGRVRVRLPYRAEVTTLGDTVHGGAIAALVDSAATAAFWAHPAASPSARGTTIGFAINFVAAGRGQDLVADARVRRRGREICTGEVSVTDMSGREVAVALVTYKMSLPG
jgi:uncharacterized protein (TIGR00369 family)